MQKIYTLETIKNNETTFTMNFVGRDVRATLDSAMKMAEKFVKRGKTVRISCENELVWEGNFL